ncbi:hypothetical protein B9Z19DRAFT_1062936 [Tuber borchii]|uniref:Uncharacterized protein n=1 Tax=Tuber borchii TaxID=42251 RepID=A0A2T7A022_TUBBO|nr:hypothetical protein B9Z19DRAFT_1062936 [Tuber borchii]
MAQEFPVGHTQPLGVNPGIPAVVPVQDILQSILDLSQQMGSSFACIDTGLKEVKSNVRNVKKNLSKAEDNFNERFDSTDKGFTKSQEARVQDFNFLSDHLTKVEEKRVVDIDSVATRLIHLDRFLTKAEKRRVQDFQSISNQLLHLDARLSGTSIHVSKHEGEIFDVDDRLDKLVDAAPGADNMPAS